MWHGWKKLKKRRGGILQSYCLHVIISLYPGFSTKARKCFSLHLIFSSLSLCSSLNHWPVKNGTIPFSHCSYNRVKDCPYLIPLLPKRAKICHSLSFSQRYFPPRSLLRELSLEQHVIRTTQDVHNLPEQTQKTTVWYPIEWINSTKTDGCKLTNELE